MTSNNGISAATAGGGNVTVTTSRDVSGGSNDNAIVVGTTSGTATVNVSGGTLSGAVTGIKADATTSGNVVVNMTGGQIGTVGTPVSQKGIVATSGSGSIDITSTSVFATDGGISATIASGTGNTSIKLSGDVSTTFSNAVAGVSGSTGVISIVSTGNISSTNGNGILAQSTAATTSGDLTINHTGNVNGFDGIVAFIGAAGNNANIFVTEVGTVTAVNEGISAQTAGGGNVTVSTSNNVTGGPGGFGIATKTTSGTNSVNITGGTVQSAPGSDGVTATATTGKLVVNNSGTVLGGATGVHLIGGNANAVTNSGNISGVTGVAATAGSTSVFNAGTIAGTGGTAIQFAGSGNILTVAPTSVITGNAIGTGADLFQLGGTGTGSFDASQIGPAAQYRGFGAFAKVGASTWTLTGTNALALPWTVQQGVLDVAGTLANSPFTVQAGTLLVTGTIGAATVNGGLLTGNGTIGTTQINGGGTFAPGTPGAPGTSMTVSGNLAFQSGAIYLVQINPATASFANVTGTAALAGNVLAAFAPGAYVQKQYDILHAAGGLSGTFAGAVSTTPGFATNLSYTNTDVFLNLKAGLGLGGNLNINQQNVANTINNFFNNGGSLPPGFATLFGISGGNLANALTQLAGEAATGSQQVTFNAMGLFLGVLTDPFIAGRGTVPTPGSAARPFAEEDDYGASAYASNGAKRTGSERDAYGMITKARPRPVSFDQRWSVWAAGYGGSQTTDGNANLGSNSTTSRLGGVAVGADYRFSPDTIAGFALAGGGTSFNLINGLGSGRSDLFQAGAFVRHTVGPAYISGALAYGWQDITTNRTVMVFGIDQLRAQFNANAFSGRLEGGYRFVTPWMGGVGITPYAAGQFTTFDLPAYAEQAVTGASTFGLAYGAKSVTDTRSELGLRTDKSYAMADGVFTLRGRVAWAHDFNPDRNIGATFQTLPGASFVVNGAAQASDSALVTASAEKKWLNGWSAAATFEGEFSSVTQSFAGKGAVRYAW